MNPPGIETERNQRLDTRRKYIILLNPNWQGALHWVVSRTMLVEASTNITSIINRTSVFQSGYYR